jgi:hypothetical protein
MLARAAGKLPNPRLAPFIRRFDKIVVFYGAILLFLDGVGRGDVAVRFERRIERFGGYVFGTGVFHRALL